MLKIKTSSKTIKEDYVATDAATGITAISGRHVIGIISVCIISIILALPYGKLIPNASSPLLSIISEQEQINRSRQEKYLTANEQDIAENIEIASTAGSEENYDDMDVPKNILANTSNEESSEFENSGALDDYVTPTTVLRQRFESLQGNLAANSVSDKDTKVQRIPESEQLSKLNKIQDLMALKNTNIENSLIENILNTDSQALLEAEIKNNKSMRPNGTWYQQTVHKGDTFSQIFSYLNLPYATLKKITAVAKKTDLRLNTGEVLQFLIDKENIVLELVKPLSENTQVRFTRMSADDKFTAVYEKTNSHIKDPQSISKFANADQMPLAKEAAAERKKQEELLAAAKAQEQLRAQKEAALLLEQEKALEKHLAENLKTRPRLVLGMLRDKETFEKAANRSGLTKTEIATIKQNFSGKINFKRLCSGDSFRILTDKIGTRGNITAMEIISAHDGRVILYRNPNNRAFYEENEYQPSAGAFRRFPITGKIKVNSPFNPRRMHPIRRKIVPHWGVDFKVSVGTPVYAPADGTVKFAGFMRGGGYVVILNHKGGYSTVYMHLSKFDVKKGQKVHMGQVIAKSGNTGYSTGAHLHYELHINGRAVDPLKADLPSGNKATAKALRRQFESTVAILKSDLYKSSLASR